MKKRIAFLIMLCISLTTMLCFNGATAETAEFEQISSIDYVVTASGLNVRTGPSTDNEVLSVLKNGQQVRVIGQIGDWYAIYDPETGYVGAAFAQYLSLANDEPDSDVPTSVTGDPSPEIGEGLEDIPVINLSQDEQQLLSLINDARMDAGVEPLKFDTELVNVARLKAQDMVENSYFSHTSSNYGSPFDMMKQFNISYRSAGENIAGNRSIEGAFNAWINDEDHKRNLLDNGFNFTGIGIADSETYGKILVQMFIKK